MVFDLLLLLATVNPLTQLFSDETEQKGYISCRFTPFAITSGQQSAVCSNKLI